MPHSVPFLSITELHPTFAAEISGVDFSKPISEEVFKEIYAAITKVTIPLPSRLPDMKTYERVVWRDCFPQHFP